MADNSFKNTLPYEATGEHDANRAEGARQERLHFDTDTGRLMVDARDEDQQIASRRSAVPTQRPVLDQMAAQGFFIH